MRFLHIADLHIGKRLFGYSLLEDQIYVLDQVIETALEKKADCLLIAGDIYDKAVPSTTAVNVLNNFLKKCADHNLKVCLISGNHDSALRMDYGSAFFARAGIYISSVYENKPKKIVFEDEYGIINVWMVPFVKPNMMKDGQDYADYNAVYEKIMNQIECSPSQRNILLAHQFFAGASVCDSEEVRIGTLDNISTSFLKPFDYAALGHIHSPQKIKENRFRYAGTLLKYSISEIHQNKTIPCITMEKDIKIELIPVKPKKDMVMLNDYYKTIISKEYYQNINRDNYIYVLLKDEEEQLHAINNLREIYPNLIKVSYENQKEKLDSLQEISAYEKMDPLEAVYKFFKEQTGQDMNERQKDLAEKIWEDAL